MMLGWPFDATAGKLREYLDALDLNEYSLSGNLYASTSPYAGVDNFYIAYPAFSSFEHATVTEHTLYIRDANFGLRNFTPAGWSYGVFGYVQTLGYREDGSAALVGMDPRDWTLQAGAQVGKRFGKLNFDLFASADLFGRHNGYEVDFKIAYPFAGAKVQIVPQLQLGYQSEDLVNYYFGVRASEALPGRPAYSPGAATSVNLSLDATWQFHENWHAFTNLNFNYLPTEITNSPIVDASSTWSVTLGVAYDSRAFVSTRNYLAGERASFVEFGLGLFLASTKSNVDLRGSAAGGGDLEDSQDLANDDLLIPVDFTWTFGRYHRLDLAYFELKRSAQIDLPTAITLSGVSFVAGERIVTELDTRVIRFGYGFSLLRDEQKDLSLFGGLHVTDIKYSVQGNVELVRARTTAFLPVLGARGLVNFTDKLSVGANAEVFVLDFDKHSGELFDLSISGQYRVNNGFSVGVGYRYYRQDIRSGDESLVGDYRFDYHGPHAFFRIRL